MITQGEDLRITASGDYLDADVGLGKGSLDVFVKGKVSAHYSTSYIKGIVKGAKDLSDVVTLEYDQDMPMRFTFGNFLYYLAPRIES